LLSPELLEKGSCLGTVLSSFPEAHKATERLLEQVLGIKRIERLTERIGGERVAQRDAETAAFEALPLVEKVAAPSGVKPPELAGVMPDGGHLQLCDEDEDSKTHWHEYKAGCLKDMSSKAFEEDPCPEVPPMFLQRERIERLTREIGKKAAGVPASEATAHQPAPPTQPPDPPADDAPSYEPPKVNSSDVIATRRNCREFGKMLLARAWSLGMLASPCKAFVGDGSSWIWGIWERHFKAFEFVPILDVIHALTHVFAAATAGRPPDEGWEIYRRWIKWVWQGQVTRVIGELAAQQEKLGPPTETDGPTSVRRIVHDALTYLQNQSARMNYPAYRKQGLPITSSHIESTVKLLNHRVKGTEKFWSEEGAEALLQLKADTLSNTGHWEKFWHNRPRTMTGTRLYARSKT
jgi:hypothetical protein